MNKRILQRSVVILVVTLLCVWRVVAYPGLVPSRERIKENVKLGLDLKGGMHMVLQVVTDDAIRGETDQTIEAMAQELNKRNIVFRQKTRAQNNRCDGNQGCRLDAPMPNMTFRQTCLR